MRLSFQVLKALGAATLLSSASAFGQPFLLADQGRLPVLIHEDQVTMRLAASMLGRDLAALSGLKPVTATRLADCASRCIVVGPASSALVQEAARALKVDLSKLKGRKERYLRVAGQASGGEILLIAGSDARGAVYGVVDLTRELGVSAWEWWADVPVRRPAKLEVDGGARLSSAPSVEFRGIFLNDEDWGLQPWAAKTYDPAKDIGPASYARIFELLWRLKANLIWPAMHPSTKAFYQVPGNAQTAADYAIVVGTSHAEPMMRNNVGEWKAQGRGDFNYFTNREQVLGYWQERIDENKTFENMYTLGMRGVHDSAMEGVKNPEHGRDTVAEVIGVQRGMLARSLGKPADKIPLVLTVYKEVLDYYNAGLKLPDDVMLAWPDDNYGYLHQLSTPKERARKGGSGIYYHISYWGRPHDYLWLGTTHPALIRDQLQRTWANGTRRMWVVNVGDIKPAEYLIQYFLDSAFDAKVLDQDPTKHLADWAALQFGAEYVREIAAIKQEFYRLAWERRPEFMGWNQNEPTRPVRPTDYIRTGGGANLNTRVLKLDLAAEYARQHRPASKLYAEQAKAAHAALLADMAAYNKLANGKWAHMMDMDSRGLPAFAEPLYPSWNASPRRGCSVVYPTPFAVEADRIVLRSGRPSVRNVTLVSYGEQAASWSLRPGASGVRIDQAKGELNAVNGFETRLTLHYDGSTTPAASIDCGGKVVNLNLRTEGKQVAGVAGERERIVVLPGGAAAPNADWQVQPGLARPASRCVRASTWARAASKHWPR